MLRSFKTRNFQECFKMDWTSRAVLRREIPAANPSRLEEWFGSRRFNRSCVGVRPFSSDEVYRSQFQDLFQCRSGFLDYGPMCRRGGRTGCRCSRRLKRFFLPLVSSPTLSALLPSIFMNLIAFLRQTKLDTPKAIPGPRLYYTISLCRQNSVKNLFLSLNSNWNYLLRLGEEMRKIGEARVSATTGRHSQKIWKKRLW